MIAEKLEGIEKRFEAIETDMANPAVISNMEGYKKLTGSTQSCATWSPFSGNGGGSGRSSARRGRCCGMRPTRR